MYWVYILHSKADNNFYIGFSSDVDKRVKEHNAGYVSATKNRRPLVLIHQEFFETKELAIQRERFLKSKGGIRFKQRLRKRYCETTGLSL